MENENRNNGESKGEPTEWEIDIVSREDIPESRYRTPKYKVLIDRLDQSGGTLRVKTKSNYEARKIESAIGAGNRKAAREGRPEPYPGIKVSIRGSTVFIYRETEAES